MNISKNKQNLYEFVYIHQKLNHSILYKNEYNQHIKQLDRYICDLVEDDDMDYIFDLAIQARNDGIRTVPIIMTIILAKRLQNFNKTYKSIRKMTNMVILSVDEVSDAFAYALLRFKNKNIIPKAIKNGIADSFKKFSKDQFENFIPISENFSLINIINVVHPSHKTSEQKTKFEYLGLKELQ